MQSGEAILKAFFGFRQHFFRKDSDSLANQIAFESR
jgi:hypothetical protein